MVLQQYACFRDSYHYRPVVTFKNTRRQTNKQSQYFKKIYILYILSIIEYLLA
jgi:hypothetical protein